MSEKPITTIIFDVGHVLYNWDLELIFRDRIPDADERAWFMANVVTFAWHSEHDAGKPFDQMVAERSAQFPDYADHIAAYRDDWMTSVPGPMPGMAELVERIASRGVPLYGITNFGDEAWSLFRPSAPMFDHFGGIIVSGREKLVKPDPAIYRLALDRFDLRSESCLFIDDRTPNIEGAESVGINGHLFRDAATLEAELKALSLL